MAILTKHNVANTRWPSFINSLRYNWLAVGASCWTHWKNTTSNIWSLSLFISQVPTVAVIAWIAVQSPNPGVLSYLIIGAPLMAIWCSVFYGIVASLRWEIYARTIEFNLISRTSVLTVLFGRALAMMTFGVPAGIVTAITMLIVTREIPQIASYPWLIASMLFIFLGLTVIGLMLAMISALLVQYHGGMMSPLIPFISALCGFNFPIALLPVGLRIPARFIPSTWAMDSALQAIRGPASIWAVVSGWLACLAICVLYLGLTFYLYKIVEKRLRVSGLAF